MRVCSALTLILLLSGCRLEIDVPQHGRVISASGNISCESGATCSIEITDDTFDEMFIAQADPGYAFDGWTRAPAHFCGGSLTDCRIATTIFQGNEDATPLLELDLEFFLRPRFRPSDVYSLKTSMLIGGAVRSSCTVGGKLYVFGAGWETGAALDTTQQYDPETDRWTFRAPMPAARAWATAAALNGKCYLAGGAETNTALPTVLVYDPEGNRWSTAADMPAGLYSASSVAVDGKLYVMGGSEGFLGIAPTAANLFIYDPANDVWTRGADMPTARRRMAAVELNGAIYAIGGQVSRNNASHLVERYHPATGQWSSGASLPEGVISPAAAVLDDTLYVFGGFMEEMGSSKGWAYQPGAGSWQGLSPMPVARGDSSAQAIDRNILIVAGRSADHSGDPVDATVTYWP